MVPIHPVHPHWPGEQGFARHGRRALYTAATRPRARRCYLSVWCGAWRPGRRRAGTGARQSAALRVVSTEPYPYLDLRVDGHPDPVAELRRVYEVAKVELLPSVDALPTRDNLRVDLGVEIRGTLIPSDRALSGPKRARLHAVDPEAELSLEERSA